MADADPAGRRRNADLSTRALTSLVMLAIAGGALWLGGMAWTILVLAVGVGVLIEWRALVLLFTPPGMVRTLWSMAGAVYCGVAAAVLMVLRDAPRGTELISATLLAVIATDVGAYCVGRAVGGPKIAPSISPSKTWAGLGGAIIVTPVALLVVVELGHVTFFSVGSVIVLGVLSAVVAQAGDFFESWMKRRARVKDSGNLLPGHGGLFDRVDGLLSVLFLLGIALAVVTAKGGL